MLQRDGAKNTAPAVVICDLLCPEKAVPFASGRWAPTSNSFVHEPFCLRFTPLSTDAKLTSRFAVTARRSPARLCTAAGFSCRTRRMV